MDIFDTPLIIQVLLGELYDKLSHLTDLVIRDAVFPNAPRKDFLAQNSQGHRKLLQVVWNTDDKNTLDRENRALEAGMKELRIDGEIITIDSYLRKGISTFFLM